MSARLAALLACLATTDACHLVLPHRPAATRDGAIDRARLGEEASIPGDGGRLDTCCVDRYCASCKPLALYSPCTTATGVPGECGAGGVCYECIQLGSQCGGGDKTPCCRPYLCDSSRGRFETCQ